MTDLNPTNPSGDPAPEGQPAIEPTDPNAGSPYEATLVAAPAGPVQAAESARRRPVRWPVAIAVVALVLAVSALVGILVTGRAPNARVLGYVPRARSSTARLASTCRATSARPSPRSCPSSRASPTSPRSRPSSTRSWTGFVGDATNGDQTYTADIKPWFDGELAFALPALPDLGALSSGGGSRRWPGTGR